MGKALALVIFAYKGANHAGARKPLAANERDAVELCLQLLFGLPMSGLLLTVGTVQRPDLFVQGGVLRVEAVDLLLLLDTGVLIIALIPSTMF